jgi:hypothetical protein
VAQCNTMWYYAMWCNAMTARTKDSH